MVAAEKTKIFFDGNCIVCDTEVAHYKRIAPESFDIVDITGSGFDAAKFGLSPEKVQFHMHVMAPDGSILVGVDAFSHIWSRLDGYRFAAKVVKLPLIYPLAKIGYNLFAKYRHLLPKKNR